jgi:hypothetical protein
MTVISKTIPDREQYEQELRKRQQEHLAKVRQRFKENWQPCLHDSCTDCHGTGVKADGGYCIHMISCPCPKCSPTMSAGKSWSLS